MPWRARLWQPHVATAGTLRSEPWKRDAVTPTGLSRRYEVYRAEIGGHEAAVGWLILACVAGVIFLGWWSSKLSWFQRMLRAEQDDEGEDLAP